MRAELLLLFVAALALPGCVERFLLIKTEPPGARVTIDLEEQDQRTPARIEFEHYGTREIILRRSGTAEGEPEYLSYREFVELEAPWYQWFPIDIIVENLWPFTITDEHTMTVQLIEVDYKSLKARVEPESGESKPGSQ